MMKTISTAVTGFLCGVLMAAVLLYMNILNHYQVWNAGYLACMAAGIMMPFCLSAIKKGYLYLTAAQFVMITVSFLVMAGYAYIASGSMHYESSFYGMTRAFAVIHAASAAAVAAAALVMKGVKHDIDD